MLNSIFPDGEHGTNKVLYGGRQEHEVTFELIGLGQKRADGMPVFYSIIEARKITFSFLVESNVLLF